MSEPEPLTARVVWAFRQFAIRLGEGDRSWSIVVTDRSGRSLREVEQVQTSYVEAVERVYELGAEAAIEIMRAELGAEVGAETS